MRNTIEGLVQTLNEIAERKQPGQRTDRSLLAFSAHPQDRAGIAQPHRDTPEDSGASMRGARPGMIADCHPCALGT